MARDTEWNAKERTCKCLWKKGRCEKHEDECKVHCSTCHPPDTRRKVGRPREEDRDPAPMAAREPRPKRRATENLSFAEVAEDEGLVETASSSDEEVQVVHAPAARRRDWDGSAGALLRFMGLEWMRVKLPGGRKKENADEHMGNKAWSKLVSIFKGVVRRVALALCPGSAEKLVRALISPAQDPSVALAAAVLELYRASKKASLERRGLRGALIHGVGSRHAVNQLAKDVGQPIKPLSGALATRSKDDAACMLAGRALKMRTIRRKKFKEEVVIAALKFLLSEEFVGVLSWGSRDVKLSRGEVVVVPSVVRKMSRTDMYNAYVEKFGREQDQAADGQAADGDCELLPRCQVFAILGLVTNGQKRALTAVDFMLGSLIYDNFIQVERIIDLYTSPEQHRELKLHAALASNFLKNQYPKHAAMEDPEGKVCTHGLAYALERPTGEGGHKTEMECNACKFVPSFFDELRDAVRSAACQYGELGTDHAITAIDRCEDLTSTWRGQCVRVANQRRAIAQLHERMEQECKHNKWVKPREAVVVMDYKMKYVPQYYRQKSIEHFGKRGISWHGFLVIFYTYDPVTDKVDREHVYCDQILSGTNKQDGIAVAALVEVFLEQLKSEPAFDELERVSFQSDNAQYYHSNNLILALPYIGLSFGLRIERYIHTETCDGKGLIDAHFAMGMRHVDAYIGMGNNATAPGEVFSALASRRGIPNSIAQLVEINRPMLLAREQGNAAVLSELTKITRQNEMVFTVEHDAEQADDSFAYPGTVTIKTWQYSNIGDPVVFKLDVRAGTVELVSGDLLDVAAMHDGNNGGGDDDGDDGAGGDGGAEGDDDDEFDGSGDAGGGWPLAFGARAREHTELGLLRHVRRRALAAARAAEGRRHKARGAMSVATSSGEPDPADVDPTDADVDNAAQGGGTGADDQDVSDSDYESKEEDDDDVEADVELEEEEAGEPMRRDLVAYAVRYARDHVNDPGSALQLREGAAEQPEYELAAEYDAKHKLTRRGFGRRPRHGTKTGVSKAGPFRKVIAQLFLAEGNDKQHPSWVLEKIKGMEEHRYRLDLPTENDVRKEQGRLIRYKAKMSKEGGEVDYVAFMDSVQDPLDNVYSCFIDAELERDIHVKPQAFVQRASAHFAETKYALDDGTAKRVLKLYTSRRNNLRKELGMVKSLAGNAGQGGGQRGGSGTSNVTGEYKEFIEDDIINNDSTPAEVWKHLCAKYGADVNGDGGPDDFPKKNKAMTFIRNWRNNNKHKIKSRAEEESEDMDDSE